MYVAVAKLRKVGLQGILRKDERGYFLDPSVRVLAVESTETTAIQAIGPRARYLRHDIRKAAT